MHRRLNITLPEDTVRLIDTVTQKGDRSSFINEAVQYYIKQKTLNKESCKNKLRN
ncbi:hypothetical protein NIES267_34890 [Calothrix parasitica NIES-267]|uniref:Uncharacterized protein n=1 Tax=Calothrix parasitica NIES-267 TaxID=1973488 RepID=A0A1Z4LRX1_9CYAN|nr:hypothetical protein NIES267_34890 [Calothrix parasitica NIES-267]